MKIFITGAQGFVGRNLVLQCERKRIKYKGIDFIKGTNPNILKVDIRSKNIAKYIPQGTDAIIHLAGLSRDTDCRDRAYECFDINVMGTLNLIEAAVKKKAKQFIFASSEWVYGETKSREIKDENSFIDISVLSSEYALSKLVSEANLRQKFQHGFCPVTILRFGIIYGSRSQNWSAVESLFNLVKNQDKIKVGSLKTGRRFIHIRDIVSGIIKSIGLKGFHIINLTGEKLITLKDIIETSKIILNTKPKIIETNPENIKIRNISNKKAFQLLKWQPRIDLKQGLCLFDQFLLENNEKK